MNYPDQQAVVTALRAVAKAQCFYTKQPCDCKYGFDGAIKGETSGCPETSLAAVLISRLDPDEYADLCGRLDK